MNSLTCCLFVGWSDLWVGAVCENPFFWRVFVRISWTQNGKKHFVIFGAGWQVWCASFFGIFPHPKGNGRYRSLEGSPNSILWGKRWVFGGREGPLKFPWVWIQRPKIDGVYTPGNNMEPKNSPNWNGISSSKPPFLGSMLIFRGVDVFPFPKWAFSGSNGSCSWDVASGGYRTPTNPWKARNAFNSNVALWICKLPCRAPSTSGCKKKSRSERRKKFTYMMNQ